MAVTDDIAIDVLVASARHCCLCRRFQPLLIQVHHIVQPNEGGTDNFDNLIPLCISCHSTVHTSPSTTRRIGVEELRRARNNVYEMVRIGRLPASSSLTHEEIQSIAASIADAAQATENPLPHESVELLVAAASEKANIIIDRNPNRSILKIGYQVFWLDDWGNDPHPKSRSKKKGFMLSCLVGSSVGA